MRKLVWLLALLCLAPAYYSCSNAQTPPVQSSNVAAPPTTLGNEPTLIDSSQNKNSAIQYIVVSQPDPNTGGQMYFVGNKDQSFALVFKDAKTQKVLRTLTTDSLKNLNPYYHLPFKNIETLENHSLNIDMTNVSIAKKNELIAQMHKDKYQKNWTLKTLIVSPIQCSFYGQFMYCYNELSCFNEEDGLFGTQSNIQIFDATGKQYAHLNDKEYGISGMCGITSDGKYLMTQYGGLWGEGGNIMEMGYRIYELPSGKLIKHFSDEFPYYSNHLSDTSTLFASDRGTVSIRNLFYISEQQNLDEKLIVTRMIVFDPAEKCYYTRSLSDSVKEFTSEGIVLRNNAFVSFKKDFKKYNF